ncbi:chemotaxis protein CheW [Sulfurimonas sp. MAG313]|nr:chemotaxis protein CheW [Sulfurimonas sp. MAG313]MDF1881116.1 chemotaxis protein CheW [Sulfurimonas sp. MAG313]
MKSYVIFSCDHQLYGINIDYVLRILSSQNLTLMSGEEEHIEGMFMYEEEILKVVSLRHLLGKKSYALQLQEFFPELKGQHQDWIDALVDCVDKNVPFTKTTDPHACHLGKWIDSFHPDNTKIVETMKHLTYHHEQLHHSALDVLDLRDESQEKAHAWIENNVQDICKTTLSYLDDIQKLSSEVAVDMQQCLVLLDKEGNNFGLNIDKVEEIVHVEESELHVSKDRQAMGEFMDIEAILSVNGKLVSILHEMMPFKNSE